MNRRQLEWMRGFSIWFASLGLYLWLGGESLRLVWWASTVLLVGGALISFFGPSRMTISHASSPPCVQAGDSVEMTVRFTYHSILPLPWLVITDRFGDREYRKLLFPGMRRRLEYTYSLNHVPRGVWSMISSEVEWGDMFGWFRRSRSLQGSSAGGLTVLPRPTEWPENLIPQHGYEMDIEAEWAGVRVWNESRGAGLRDYVPGDPMNRIHWKNSAKLGRLQTFMPHEGWESSQGIVLDTSFHGYSGFGPLTPEVAFEDTVSAAAGLVSRLIRSRAPYQLWMDGTDPEEQRAEFEGTLKAMGNTLVPLAAVSLNREDSMLWNHPRFEETLKAPQKNTEWSIITGGFHQRAAMIGIKLLNAGSSKVTIFCTQSIRWLKSSGNLSSVSYEKLAPPEWTREFLGKGGKLVYLGEQPEDERSKWIGGAAHGRDQQLAR